MAIQTGVVKIRGSLGDVTFFRTADGFKAKMKGGPTKQQFKQSRRFARSRESATEFGRAGKGVRLLKEGIGPYLLTCADTRFYGRLTAALLKVVTSDSVNKRGKRKLLPENMHLLSGFRMKKEMPSRLLQHTKTVKGGIQTDVVLTPVSTREVNKSGATHVRLFLCVSSLDLKKMNNVTTAIQSKVFSVKQNLIQESFVYSGAKDDVLVLFAGVEYLQFVNGEEQRIVSVSSMELAEVVD